MFSKLMDKALDHPVISFTSVVAVAVASVVGLAAWDESNWQQYSAQHQCKAIAHTEGHSMYGFHNGKFETFYVPGTDTYQCDNGQYTR